MYQQKAVAYILHEGHLLVFRQPASPEAGIQVPAGTVQDGESPEAAVLREAAEETGLRALEIEAYLGSRDYEFPQGAGGKVRVRRHYFQLGCRSPQDLSAQWSHLEADPSEGGPGPIEFRLFWVRYPEQVPPLSGRLDDLLEAVQPDS